MIHQPSQPKQSLKPKDMQNENCLAVKSVKDATRRLNYLSVMRLRDLGQN